MSPLADLVRLSGSFGGRIPDSVPAHYVEWALSVHRRARTLAASATRVSRPGQPYPKAHWAEGCLCQT